MLCSAAISPRVSPVWTVTTSSPAFGAAAGEISAEHRQAALDELQRRRTLRAAREDEQREWQRRRAELLHAFESTTLSLANFCALKGVAADELPALLELARREAEQRRLVPPPRPPGRPAAPPRARPPRGA